MVVLAGDVQFGGKGAEEGGVPRLCKFLGCMWRVLGEWACLLDVVW